MKNSLKQINLIIILQYIVLLLYIVPVQTNAQPQWKFHVAYEDATGAKDTIWFIWDTTATFYGADTALGEVSANIDYSVFNVWTSNYGLEWYDTIKTVAYPYSYGFGNAIETINCVLPITIKWDTSLLHADWLPPEPVGWVNQAALDNDYFYWYPNDEWCHCFDMTIADSVMAPEPDNTDPLVWIVDFHFPMYVGLAQDTLTLISNHINIINTNQFHVFPNPFSQYTTFEFYLKKRSHIELTLYNLQGQFVKSIINEIMKKGFHQIKWNGFDNASQACKPGVYLTILRVNGKLVATHKIVKQ